MDRCCPTPVITLPIQPSVTNTVYVTDGCMIHFRPHVDNLNKKLSCCRETHDASFVSLNISQIHSRLLVNSLKIV